MAAASAEYWSGMLPKSETEAADFVLEHPGWDGRGVVVGILDTGVDPGAIGLQTTSDGKPKVIDIIDCSGSGDVIMSPLTKANDDKTLEGIGGRVLRLNPNWTNPTGEYRVGIKRAFDLYPGGLKRRVTEERKKKWMLKHKNLEMNVQKLGKDSDDLKARAALVKSFEKDYEDPGPIYDCLVFHDGTRWQSVVDTTETGDMSKLESMTDYRVSRQFARFSELDALNYCVNIYDNGDILSINTDAGAHGSHVAGITAAFHPDCPEQNGVAPGAQIVALKIGNTRLGSMETSPGLIRALLEAVKRGCHIINMSYGEAAARDNTGAFVKLAEEITTKYGVVFVGSAGNNGPALTTMGAPCGTSSCVIAVGALVTNSLIQTAYDTVTSPEKLGETNYTWSSMGPCADGHSGVSIIAPGGAITCVPNWTLAKNQLMNGTSMSAPNATGCITLLLSAAKANNISKERLNPMVIRRVVQNFALTLSNVEPLGQGHGLIQVKNAWNNIAAFNPTDGEIIDPWYDVTYEVSINSLRFSRGIYLRQPVEANTATSYKIEVKPVFFNKDEVSPDRLIQFEMRLRIESTVDWIKCPQTLQMHKNGKTIAIDVDPRALPVGKNSLGFVFGYDENHPAKGAVFEIPVTVIRPVFVSDNQVTLSLEMPPVLTAGQRERKFFVPPSGCSFIDAVITDKRPRATPIIDPGTIGSSTSGAVSTPFVASDDSATRMVCIHALQVVTGEPYEKHEKQQYLHMEPGGVKVVSFPVLEGVTVELCMASYWSTAGDVNITLEVNFKGVRPSPSSITINGGQRVSDVVRVYNPLETTDVAPVVKLDKWRQVIKPTALGKISSLGERDMMLDGTCTYQLINEYEVDQTEAGEMTPRFPALQGILYESSFTGQYFYVYDSTKKVVGTGDAFPKGIKTGKGKHTVVLQVRAESISALEGFNDMPCLIERSLKSSISLSSHSSQTDAARGVGGSKSYPVQHGSTLVLFFKEPSYDQLPKSASAGDYLLGSVTYTKSIKSQQGSGTEPKGYPVRYNVADTKVKEASSGSSACNGGSVSTKDDEDKLSVETMDIKMSDTVRDSKVKFLSDQCSTPELFDPMAKKLLEEYPSHIPLRLVVLDRKVKFSKENKSSAVAYTSIIECAEAVVTLINQDDLAKEFGTNLDKDDKKAAAARKEAETTKASLITALSAKAAAIISLNGLGNSNESKTDGDVDLLADAIKSLQKWDDIDADKHWQLMLSKDKAAKNWGLVLKKINDLLTTTLESKPSKTNSLSRDDLLSEQFKTLEHLGEDWAHIKDDLEKWVRYLKRNAYEAF